jgi:hypothetical protein
MNILSRMLLSASPMIVVAGSIFMLLSCSSNVGVLGSNGDGIENMEIHFSGEFVTISLLFPILIGFLINTLTGNSDNASINNDDDTADG